MRGMDYLVGVRFQASGNLYDAMGRLSASMLAADEATSLLKNRFVDMAAAGVGMFAALTSASVQYTNTVAKLAVTLGGVKNLHKDLGFVLGAPGSAKYLSSDTLTSLVSTLNPLYYGHPPKGALSGAARIAGGVQYGLSMSGAQAARTTEGALVAGYRYGQNMGERSPLKLEHTSMGVAKAIFGHMQMVLSSQRQGYMSTSERVFSSPLISALGKKMSPNMIATMIGALTNTGVPGAVMSAVDLFAGKGATNKRAIELLMNKQFGFGVATNNNILAAASGNYIRLATGGRINPLAYLAQHALLGLERMYGMTTGAFIPPSKLTEAQRKELAADAKLDFGSRSPALYGLALAELRKPSMLTDTKGNWATIKKYGDSRTQRQLNLIESSADRVFTQIGAGADVHGVLQFTGNTLAGMATYMSKHPNIAKGVGGPGLAGAFTAISGGALGVLGMLFSKLGLTSLGGGMKAVGGKALAPLAMFQMMVSGAGLLRAIPAIRIGENFITKWMSKVQHVNKGIFDLMKSISDFGWMIATFNFHKYFHGFVSNLGKFFMDTWKENNPFSQAVKLINGTPFGKHHTGKGSTAFDGFYKMLSHGHHYSVAWNAHEAYFNKKKDMEQWDLSYNNPLTHKAVSQEVHVHFHGANTTSKAGLKDVQDALVKALRSTVSGHGVHTAAPLASGR